MNKIKKELEDKLERIMHVYIFAQEAYLYSEYFHNPKSDEELKLVTASPHRGNLTLIMHLMFRTLIIEISKLFSRSDNDKFRLSKFIESLSLSGHFKKICFSQTLVEKWKNEIDKNESVISDILLMRSKIYAHTDNPLSDDYNEIDISFKQIKVLLDIAQEIIKTVYAEIFDTELNTNSPTFDRDNFIILKLLAKAETDRVNDIMQNWKK